MPLKMHKIIFFSRKKKCVPTLPRIFRPINRNTLIFLFGLSMIQNYNKSYPRQNLFSKTSVSKVYLSLIDDPGPSGCLQSALFTGTHQGAAATYNIKTIKHTDYYFFGERSLQTSSTLKCWHSPLYNLIDHRLDYII